MSEFGRDDDIYADLMKHIVHLQSEGNHRAALWCSSLACRRSAEGSLERGKAARAGSVSAMHLGHLASAEDLGREAYYVHSDLITKDPEKAERVTYVNERGMSAGHLGRLSLLKSIEDNHARGVVPSIGYDPTQNLASALLTRSRRDLEWIDRNTGMKNQYAIDAMPWFSVMESLRHRHHEGRRLGVRAVSLARYAESPSTLNAHDALTPRERRAAKKRAFNAGMAALATAGIATVDGDFHPYAIFGMARRAITL